ncbi:hypothetical protein AURDEDRAFT_114566 [Auricularia subglabra TFB-10046 SS5]|nr:hypothetical protein AURDEDRAFT_114566 [Auricularia subglabra TFB-10046 SS5]
MTSLDNDVLLHIQSFLDTQDTARLTLVSRSSHALFVRTLYARVNLLKPSALAAFCRTTCESRPLTAEYIISLSLSNPGRRIKPGEIRELGRNLAALLQRAVNLRELSCIKMNYDTRRPTTDVVRTLCASKVLERLTMNCVDSYTAAMFTTLSPLRALHLSTVSDNLPALASHLSTLLRTSRNSLQELSIESSVLRAIVALWDNEPISFPRLRKLSLTGSFFADRTLARVFPSIQSLSLPGFSVADQWDLHLPDIETPLDELWPQLATLSVQQTAPAGLLSPRNAVTHLRTAFKAAYKGTAFFPAVPRTGPSASLTHMVVSTPHAPMHYSDAFYASLPAVRVLHLGLRIEPAPPADLAIAFAEAQPPSSDGDAETTTGLPPLTPITKEAMPPVFDMESHAKFWTTFAESKVRASTLQSVHIAYEFDNSAGLPSAETQRALIENMLVKLPALPSTLDVLTVSVGEALRWQWRRSTTLHNALPASPHMQPVSADDAAERLQLETAW